MRINLVKNSSYLIHAHISFRLNNLKNRSPKAPPSLPEFVSESEEVGKEDHLKHNTRTFLFILIIHMIIILFPIFNFNNSVIFIEGNLLPPLLMIDLVTKFIWPNNRSWCRISILNAFFQQNTCQLSRFWMELQIQLYVFVFLRVDIIDPETHFLFLLVSSFFLKKLLPFSLLQSLGSFFFRLDFRRENAI